MKPYRAPWWLPGGHVQTLYAYFFARKPRVVYRRERWEMSDGDFLDLDWIDGDAAKPLLVLFHGLEGSSRGHYARALMGETHDLGWRGVAVNFRGCSGTPNRLPRAYHSGDSAEIDRVLRHLKSLAPGVPLYAAGVSLGANALLKWLGESGMAAQEVICAAAAVSAPVDLADAGKRLDRGWNRHTYTRVFLHTLRQKTLRKIATHHLPISAPAIRAARTLYAFDDLYTAPVHGYRDADDYWLRASSGPWLNSITVPTLIVHAHNDPFLPASAFPHASQISPAITLDLPREGGHVGFVNGPFPGYLTWLPNRILEFFAAHRGG
jgi:predicted alpha/beta-fold hydrolase